MIRPKLTTELVRAFIGEHCNIDIDDPSMFVPKQVLFDAWRTWCAESDRTAGNNVWFGRCLLHIHPQLKTDRITINNKRCYAFIGIELINTAYGQEPLLRTKITALYHVLHKLSLFPDKFNQAKRDIRAELDELKQEIAG